MAKIAVSLCALLVVLASIGETMSSRSKGKRSCCTKFQAEPLPLDKIRGYSLDRPGTCRLNGVKFFTVRNRIICADPNMLWVQKAMDYIRNQLS